MLNRAVVFLLACGIAACSLPAAAQTLNKTTPLHYWALETPCRAIDTTLPVNTTVPAQTILAFNPGAACSIPQPSNGVIAYAVNVTVKPEEGGVLGFLAIWPAGDPKNAQQLPPTSTVNSQHGTVKTNAAIVAGGYQGEVDVYADASSPTDFALDVSGYFTTDPAYVYVPITPCRLVDTRIAGLGAPSLTANQPRVFPLVNNPCKLPPEMFAHGGGALSLNVTAIPHGSFADVTVWGTSPTEPEPQPPTFPTLIVANPFVAANAAIVTMENSASDSVSVSATADVDLVMDISGYFAPLQYAPSGLSLYLVSPCRLVDTRFSNSDSLDWPPGGFNGEVTVPVGAYGNGCNVPNKAQAYVLNATVVPLPVLGSLTLWADGTPQPVASTLNAPDGDVTSNMAIVASFDGSIDAFAATLNPGEKTYLILDVSGYFDPGP